MARGKAIAIENNFIGGLNTEATALRFPPNACSEQSNCVFNETGRVKRRGAFDLEPGYGGLNETFTIYSQNEAFAEFLWTDVGGAGTVSFLVQQQGLNLLIYDVSASTTPSANRQAYAASLSFFAAANTVKNPAEYLCQFAQGNGFLLVVNPACQPFRITYDSATREFSAVEFAVQYRDFLGLDAGYALTDRPAFSTVGAMKADTAGSKHYYNLLNQGWWNGVVSGGTHDATLSALGIWDTSFGFMPSDADAVSYYRSSTTVPLDPATVLTYTQGNTPAPKGHFILEIGAADRYTAMTDEGFTLSGTSDVDSIVDTSALTKFGDFTSSVVYDNSFITGSTRSSGTASGSNITRTVTGYSGVTFAAPTRVFSVILNASSVFNYGKTAAAGATKSLTAYVYAKNGAAPANGTDGTLLSFTPIPENTTNGFGIGSNDTTTLYDHVWIYLVGTLTSTGSGVVDAEVSVTLNEVFFREIEAVSGIGSLPASDNTSERFTCVEFFAGRAWYAGVDFLGLNNNIYFSQIIEKPEQFGRCYQQNDPTSEEFFDLLPSDGGVVRIPEIGRIIKLFNYQNVLLVFATNGVWIVRGSSDRGGFTATDFSVRRISSLGTQSPQSFIDVKGFPMWWGEEGLLMIDYNPQFDSFSVASATEETIKTFYQAIPPFNRKFAKGAYDVRNEVAYWLYSDESDQSLVRQCEFNKVLCYNTRSKAFYTWEIGDNNKVKVRGIAYIEDSIGISDPGVRYTITWDDTPGTDQFVSYAAISETSYIDWETWAAVVSQDEDDEVDYTSYFVTGYRLDAETMKYYQSTYVMTFLERESNAGVYMQGVWDFAFDPGSGNWTQRQESYQQETYDEDLPYHSIITRRLKVRGRGRCLQLRFTSQSGKPFTIIGWSIFETANADL